MPRVVGYVALWLVATTVAAFVAWQGVAVVGTQVTEARPAPLTPEQARQARLRPPPPPAEQAPAPSGEPAGPGSAPVPPGGSPPAPPTPPPAPPPDTPATTGAPGTTTSTTTATAGPGAGEDAQTRTYNVEGGSVALHFATSGVSVLWANPRPGFEVAIEERRHNGVVVTFRSPAHRSTVEGWWQNGPRDRVREEEIRESPGDGPGTP